MRRTPEEQQQLRIWKNFFNFVDMGYRAFSADEEGTGLTEFANMTRHYIGRLVENLQQGKPIISVITAGHFAGHT